MQAVAPRSDIRFARGFGLSLWPIAEALFASEAGPPPPERLQFLQDDLQDFLRHAGLRTRSLVKIALFGVDLVLPILMLKRPLRYTPWEPRVQLLSRIENSIAGLPLLFIKAVLCLIYYEHPDAQEELYQGGAGCLKVIE